MNPMRSVRTRLIAIMAAAVLLALGLALASNLLATKWQLERDLAADLDTQAELLGQLSIAALDFDDARLASDNLHALSAQPRIRAAALYDARGRLFARYSAPGADGDWPAAAPAPAAWRNGDLTTIARKVVRGKETMGTICLRAKTDLAAILAAGLARFLVAASLPVALAVLLISRLVGRVTAPLAAMARTAREVVDRSDYARRVPGAGADEIGDLTRAFNEMLGEIERRTQALEAVNSRLQHEAEQRGLAQQEVMRLNVDLEARVRARTAELELAKAVAERANQAKSAFLSSMSHELRTPLNAIIGFSQLLNSNLVPVTDSNRAEFASYILTAGQHLLELINEVLDLAKVESGELKVSQEPVALADLVAECQAMTEPMGQKLGLHMSFDAGSGLVVRADRTRLKQVLLNLLSNAVKYNRDHGSVSLRCTSSAQRVRISVSDTGPGLSAAQLANLFQPFNRLGQENGPIEGTGIGLVVTKRLVELMNGAIGVDSQVGRGSEFWIELDAAVLAPAPQPAHGPHDAPAPDLPATVLYVEDNPANLRLVEGIFSLHPELRLISATDAPSGIELAHAHRPDLILMDLHLPGMSGHQALRILQTDPLLRSVPVVALTASAMAGEVRSGLASGFAAYLTKPLVIDEFMSTVRSLLAARRRQETTESPRIGS